MGASASRPEEEEEEPLPEPEWSRVTVNPKLLQQLAGENSSGQASGHGSEDDSREAPHHFAPGQGSFLHQPSQRTRVEEEAAALAGDLNRSRRVGGLLLRHEDDELAQVNALYACWRRRPARCSKLYQGTKRSTVVKTNQPTCLIGS